MAPLKVVELFERARAAPALASDLRAWALSETLRAREQARAGYGSMARLSTLVDRDRRRRELAHAPDGWSGLDWQGADAELERVLVAVDGR